jgi:hypothetical protein
MINIYEGSAEFKFCKIEFKLCLIDSSVADDFSGIFISTDLGKGLFRGKRTNKYLYLRINMLGVSDEFDLQFNHIVAHLGPTNTTISGLCISSFPNSSYMTGVEQIKLGAKLRCL